jgi:hypothetical protein
VRKPVLFFLLVTFGCQSQSTKSVTFKFEYRPETKYQQTIVQSSTSEITYSGSEEFLSRLQNKGIENPTITKSGSDIQTILNTGKRKKEKYPLTIEYVKATNSDGREIIPKGTIIYGNGFDNRTPKLDSIVSKDMEDSFKKSLLQTIQSTFSQITFPEKTIRVGESFSNEMPLSIPVAGITVDMKITSTFTLKNISGSVAELDVTSIYTLTSVITDYKIKATGSSNGKMYYDTQYANLTTYDTNTLLNMNLEMDNFTIDLRSESRFLQTNRISKN